MIFTDEHNVEDAVFQHARELAFAITYRQHLFGIIPMKPDNRVDAFLVA